MFAWGEPSHEGPDHHCQSESQFLLSCSASIDRWSLYAERRLTVFKTHQCVEVAPPCLRVASKIKSCSRVQRTTRSSGNNAAKPRDLVPAVRRAIALL